MRLAARVRSVVAVATVAVALLGVPAAPVAAQVSGPTSMCLLTLDEVSDLTGLPFAGSNEARGACTYASDPAVDMYALDLRIHTDPSLDSVRYEYDRGGQDTNVAGLPAWSSDDGLFVDVGERLLVVQPIFFLSDVTPDPASVQVELAELAVPRIGAVIDAAYGAEDDLQALFPTAISGETLDVEVIGGDVFFSLFDFGRAEVEGILADHGMTLADVSVASATVGDGDILAVQAPGIDASLLVAPMSSVMETSGATATPETRAGKELLAYPDRGWLYAQGDVLWIISQTDEATFEAILEELP